MLKEYYSGILDYLSDEEKLHEAAFKLYHIIMKEYARLKEEKQKYSKIGAIPRGTCRYIVNKDEKIICDDYVLPIKISYIFGCVGNSIEIIFDMNDENGFRDSCKVTITESVRDGNMLNYVESGLYTITQFLEDNLKYI